MTAQPTVRVRFAPSPTGFFHVGGARTALYNWLVARKAGGSFLLRIEDTDRARSDAQWTSGILGALEWLGITWDEGPYHQSDRGALYRAAAADLLERGRAYACDCTRAEIDARAVTGRPPGYDGFCRDRGLAFTEGRALRFRVPDDGTTVVRDIVRGDVEFEHSTIEDFVIVKSNGDPLYVLAVVADDLDMDITHVIRAEEHLPTTPKAVLIWRALTDTPLPAFAHLPVLVNERRQKLSKRRDRVAVEDYRDLGYLPEALRNYLCLLGWSPAGNREVLSVDEMIDEFRLEDVNRSPAFFDEKRLAHFNGLYIRNLPTPEFIDRAAPFVAGSPAAPAGHYDTARFAELAPLAQERVATLAEVPQYVEFALADTFAMDDGAFERAILGDEDAPAILSAARASFAEAAFDAETLKSELTAIGERAGRRLAKAQAPVRVATMGRTVGLPLFESLVLLGRDEVLSRLDAAIARVTR